MESTRLKAEESMDFERFIDVLYSLLIASWGTDWGIVSIAQPTATDFTNVTLPHIVYALKEIAPGVVGNSGTKEIRSRLREHFTEIDSVTNEAVEVNVYGQLVDYTVRFSVYEENNAKALRLSRVFRGLINEHKGYLMRKGLQNIWFQQDKEKEQSAEDRYACREITYQIRLEELDAEKVPLLESIEVLAESVRTQAELDQSLPSQQL